MQISDIYIGKRFDYYFVINSFKKAEEFNPDFVAYTDEYLITYKDELMYKELEEVLSHFVNRKLGTVGISFHRKPISLYVIIQNFATLMFGEDIIVGF